MTIGPHTLINGEWTESWAVQDRGFMYGDGVFRTLRMLAGQPVWWPDQLAKLGADCDALGLPAPSGEVWRTDLDRLAADCPDATIRLMVTRGIGERGYRPPAQPRITRIAMAYPAEAAGDEFATCGIGARFCDLRLGLQPRLAGVKHLNRLEQILARMEWDTPAIQEGVLLDQEERVISGTSSNLFILRGDRLQTPRLHRCGIAGVARARLLASIGTLGLAGEEADLDRDAILAADALFFCNSVTKLRWAARLGDRTWPCPRLFAALTECLHD